jgi:hypothetical protein
MAKFEALRGEIARVAFKVCFQSNGYIFINNSEKVCAEVEEYVGCQKGRLSQLEGFKAIMSFEIEWLRKNCKKYSQEFIYGFVQSRVENCRRASAFKCATPGCHFPRANLRAKFCPKCQPNSASIGETPRVPTGTTDAPRQCEVCKRGAILPGEIYCLECLGD